MARDILLSAKKKQATRPNVSARRKVVIGWPVWKNRVQTRNDPAGIRLLGQAHRVGVSQAGRGVRSGPPRQLYSSKEGASLTMPSDLAAYQFPVTGQTIRTLRRDDDVLVCHADACRELQHSNPTVALRLVDEADRVLVDIRETDNPNLNWTSINPKMWFITESGFYDLAIESRAPRAKEFRRWLTHDLLPTLRKTRRYELEPMDELELAERNVVLIKEKRALAARVEKAEGFKRAIEAGDGLSPREFHKKYFSTTPDKVFFEHLYRKGYLIDQRGKGGRDPETGDLLDGPQHRHPSAKGKPWFYRHGGVSRNGRRFENTYVRPGAPELELRARLAAEGLVPNEPPAGLFELGEAA